MANNPSLKFTPIGSDELQRQIDLLKYYPEIFDKHFYPAMQDAAQLVEGGIGSNISEYRRLQPALGSKVRHSGSLGTSAHIGFGSRYGKPSARMAAPLNQGVQPHEVNARNAPNLHFSSRAQGHAILKSMQHPGFTGRHFMEAGLEEVTGEINGRMNAAANQVVEELAKP